MVLKKPYGILIKHFKLIHLLLAFLMMYTTSKMQSIYKFFLNYISAGWLSINLDEIKSYVNLTCYISIVLILIILIIIYLLMRFKKKPNLYYKIAIPTYIISFIVFIVSSHTLSQATTEVISPLNTRIYRDISLIMYIVQLILLIVPVLRGIGFDVKKFNFKKDIADLHIEDIDSEEIELNINIDKNKIKRKLNKFGRNSSYIFLRNKIIIYRILLIGIIISLGYFSVNVFVTNKVYKEGKIVNLDKYSIKINKSYLTKYNNEGEIISNNYKYIVVNFTPINKIENNTFNLDKIDIKIGDKYYYPQTTLYKDFRDLGYGYNDQILGTNNNLDYIMVFKLPVTQKTNRVILRYINETKYKNNNTIRIYKNFKLKLNDDTKNIMNINNKLSSSININSNIFKVDKYEIANQFNYTYKECEEENCIDINKNISASNYGYSIMKLSGEFKLQNKAIAKHYKNYNDYYEPMIYIKYKINDENKKMTNIDAITPTKVIENNNKMYIEVPNEINNAEEVNLHLKTRNTDYNIKLK